MTFLRWFRFRLVSLLFVATPAHASPKIHIYPVELLGYAGDAVRLAVELPCGGRFYGLVAAVNGKTLNVAAAIAQDPVACTAMPAATEIRVDYLATTRFKTIAPMAVEEGARLSVARIEDLKIGATNGAPRLTAIYAPRCGRDMGTLIHRVGARRLEVAFVEQQPIGAHDGCPVQPRTRRITALDLGAHFTVVALRDAPKALTREYTLALAPVKAGGIRATADAVTVTYRRACNEAPVGLVLGEDSDSATQVGVLVARYYNYPCSGAATWTSLAEDDVSLPRRTEVAALKAPAAGADLRLHEPTRLARDVNDLDVAFLADCGANYGVYSHDWRGALSVGVLTIGSPGSKCKRTSGEVSLSQSFVASSVPAGELYPMRLRSLPAR